jgi:hypothetical protein
MIESILMTIFITLGIIALPFAIYAIARLVSLATITSWFELKRKFNKEGSNNGEKL